MLHPRRSSCALLILAVCVTVPGVMAQEAEAAKASPRRLTLESVSPKNTLLFGSFAGLEASSHAADDLGLLRLFQDPDTQAFLAPMLDRYRQLAAESSEDMIEEWEAMTSLMKGRVSFTLTGLSLTSGSTIPVIPSAVVAVDAGAGAEEFQALVSSSLDDLSMMFGDTDLSREVKPFKGVDVHVITASVMGLDFTICHAVLENLFLVSMGQGPIRKCINFSTREGVETLATSEAFTRSRAQSRGTPVLELFANLQASRRKFKLLIPDSILDPLDAAGIGQTGAIYMSSAVHGGDSLDTIYVDTPEERTGLMALDGGKPVSPASRALIPQTALMAVALRCDLAKAWDTLMTTMDAVDDPTMGAQLRRRIERMTRSMGVDVRNELLAAVGDEFVMYADMPAGLRTPKIVMSMAVDDRAKAQSVLDGLTSTMPLDVRRFKRGDALVYSLAPQHSRQRIPASPCFCLLDDRLLMSASRSGMDDALDRLPAGAQSGALEHNPSFRSAMGQMPWKRASMIWWLDAKRVLGLGYEAAYDTLPMIAPVEMPLDMGRIPDRESFLQHIQSFGGVAVADGKGILLQGRTPGIAAITALLSRFVLESPGVPSDVLPQLPRMWN